MDLEELEGEEDQDDAKDNGAENPPEDTEITLPLREASAGESDDYRIVPAEHDVDRDELQNGDPKLWASKLHNSSCCDSQAPGPRGPAFLQPLRRALAGPRFLYSLPARKAAPHLPASKHNPIWATSAQRVSAG